MAMDHEAAGPSLSPLPGQLATTAGLSANEHRALRVLAGFAETALPAMLLLYLAANERSADTLPELKQVIDTLSEVPVKLDGQGAEPIHTAVGRLYSMVGALRGRIG